MFMRRKEVHLDRCDKFQILLVLFLDCGLFDLGYARNKFTWSNNHKDERLTKLRFDGGVASHSWRQSCDAAKVYNLFYLHGQIIIPYLDNQLI